MWLFVLDPHSAFIAVFSCSIFPMQWLLSFPKTDRKLGLQIYGRCLEAKTSEIPVRKSDILTLALLLNQGEKMREYVLGANSGFIAWTGVSKLSVKVQLQKEQKPHRSQDGARQERKETWITDSNNCWEVETTSSLFGVQNLSSCVSIQVNLIWKEMYLWTCTKLNQISFPSDSSLRLLKQKM